MANQPQDLTEVAKILLATYKDHAGIVNTLWNIFQIVALGVVGLVYKDHRAPASTRLRQGHYVFPGLVVFALWIPLLFRARTRASG